ncbi:MAG: anhydro-N-acetylmuramic acid kinase [Bacteroidia bacterium]|nr:MAG: anhydro-N-acetylmuramic acid kinase [Bacteroidia bacterium]
MAHQVIGLMSGTSLDGLDLAACSFKCHEGEWSYDILAAETTPYSPNWISHLQSAPSLGGRDLIKLHLDYGHHLGKIARSFREKNDLKQDILISSHGHTVFHEPANGYTFQLGHGAAIAASARATVVSDLRSMDVANGGQGAPLVPMGDRLLFPEYDYCLNIGGFANISFEEDGERLAFDICPANFVINRLVRQAKIPAGQYMNPGEISGTEGFLDYDPQGIIARSGKLIPELLQALDNLSYYKLAGPKSLGEEWVKAMIWPLITESIPLPDILHTFTIHVVSQISGIISGAPGKRVLVTGGGAYNTFFMERLKASVSGKSEICIPHKMLIEFKEALVFAFLGLLCMEGLPNCLSSVTGARSDTIGGSIHRFSR